MTAACGRSTPSPCFPITPSPTPSAWTATSNSRTTACCRRCVPFTNRGNRPMRRIALLLVLLPMLSLALPEDSNQPIQIESNSAQRNDPDNTLVYEGAVRIVQGSMHITADRVTVHFVDGEPERIVCDGTPATYRQQQKANAAPIDARARQIDYHLNDNLVVLTGSARVEQEGSVLE